MKGHKLYDWMVGLDVPMISPAMIPDGYQQDFDELQQKYVLKKRWENSYAPRLIQGTEYSMV